ncbi:hypothetical protein [Radiobacillus deserti]|uniref:Uncharacterized protein n=1 Tax=Radiobacillus deserti TaxID=2594883 RepID=A0A516KHK1_9BACI|nr:hypothetical protein [Radiobacillus deserti]QDP40865.1 hypothetical protein FN924_12105 [Radiobacillus deserti]
MIWVVCVFLLILLCIVVFFLPIYTTCNLVLIPKQSEIMVSLKIWKIPILKRQLSFDEMDKMPDISTTFQDHASYSDPYLKKIKWMEKLGSIDEAAKESNGKIASTSEDSPLPLDKQNWRWRC